METALIIELLRAVWRELIQWRTWIFVLFVIVTFVILAVGIKWPERYETSTMIHVDTTNIIQPLLQGKASFTSLDYSKEAREQIFASKILQRVALSAHLTNSDSSFDEKESAISFLRSNIRVVKEPGSYFSIKYSDVNQDRSFNVLNAVVDEFIKDSSASRRDESRSAFEFIDQQVETYKRQLVLAENKLKEFQSRNLDGTTGSVSTRINQLRLQIEDQKLLISETEIQKQSIDEQLTKESKFVEVSTKLDSEKVRLQSLRGQLDILRMKYQETYPDIVSLKEQINSQMLVITAMQGDGYITSSSSDSSDNPLFGQLRSQKSQLELSLLSQKRRLDSQQALLEAEYERAERVASRQAELSELTRDYDVNKDIYEQMLGRKERARLSMTLDVEGQGVNFKIQEPPVFPLGPTGVRFVHFAIAAPFAGLFISLGLLILYVLVDVRARSAILLMGKLSPDIELLAVIPHINTPLTTRLLRMDMIVLSVAFLVALSVYITLAYSRIRGYI